MNNFMIYLLKVNIVLNLLYIVYRIIFHNNVFHKTNRVLLLFILYFSLICPVCNLHIEADYELADISVLLEGFSEPAAIGNNENYHEVSKNQFNTFHLVYSLYLFGILFFLIRFVNHFRFIFNVKKRSSKLTLDHYEIYCTNIKVSPFSFFKWIFIPDHYFKKNEKKAIILHEHVHVKQWHSLDLVFTEIYCIISWFNPFVFLFKKSLKNMHEYLADSEVVKNQMSAVDYLNCLSSCFEMNAFSGMVSGFKLLTFKNRIKMITKTKKSKIGLISYFIMIPIVIFLLHAFSPTDRDTVENTPSIYPIDKNACIVTQGYGYTKHPFTKKTYLHEGIDFCAEDNTPIKATSDGKIIEIGDKSDSWGKYIVIKHSAIYATFYAHLSGFNVNVGDVVKKGETVGFLGHTGLTTGPHLHYEVWKNGEKVDPNDYLPDTE